MNKTSNTTGYKLIKKVKGSSFDSKSLSDYTLSLLVGIKDFQFCAITSSNEVQYMEDYKLEGLRTINDRLRLIEEIFNKHALLRSYKWGSIKLCFKSQKFSIVPSDYFVPEHASDFLILNNEINPKIESIYHYRHPESNIVNVFTSDHKITKWVINAFPSKKPQLVHQGSAFIEGVLRINKTAGTSVAAFVDRGILHIAASKGKQLLFYNQFLVQKSEDFLKFILTVYKELKLSPKSHPLTIWGMFNQDSPHIAPLKKYITNIQFGTKPFFLSYVEEFKGVAPHRYFDLFSLYACQ